MAGLKLEFPVLFDIGLDGRGEPVAGNVAPRFAKPEYLDPVGFKPQPHPALFQRYPYLPAHTDRFAINDQIAIAGGGFGADGLHFDPRIGFKPPAPILRESRVGNQQSKQCGHQTAERAHGTIH